MDPSGALRLHSDNSKRLTAQWQAVARFLYSRLFLPARISKTMAADRACRAASAAELEREVRSLRRELQEVRQQREILKKALALFSEAPR